MKGRIRNFFLESNDQMVTKITKCIPFFFLGFAFCILLRILIKIQPQKIVNFSNRQNRLSEVHNITESLMRMLNKRRQNLFTFLSKFVTKKTIFQEFQKQLTLCKGFQTLKQRTCFISIHQQHIFRCSEWNWILTEELIKMQTQNLF